MQVLSMVPFPFHELYMSASYADVVAAAFL
jgi:hypothetical protein